MATFYFQTMHLNIRRFLSEPFIQFIVLGGLLYILVAYVQKQADKQSTEIVIDGNRVGLMLMNYKTQTGNLPTKQQLNAMIETYIKEEISYREAKKMGLDKDDEIIRRRLSQKFDFLQTDLDEVETPTVEELLHFYKNNQALFQNEPTVSFSHIYFSTDKSTDSIAKQKARDVLLQVKPTSIQRAPEKGDRFALQYDYTNQGAIDIQQNFGNKQMLDILFSAPLNTWTGPVQSGYGWHLIYIEKRDTADVIPYATIKEEVKQKCIEAIKVAQNKKVYDALSEKYNVTRSYLDEN